MSDKVLMQPPNVLVADGSAFMRYRPAFTSLHVFDRTDCGRRIEVNEDGHVIIFDLTAQEARHLASLLIPNPKQGPGS